MNTLLSAIMLVVCAIALSFVWPEIEDHHAEQDAAKEALIQQRQQQRFEKAAQDICGPNSAYKLTDNDKEIICMNKKGRVTGKVEL
jgi:hypothetical protein